MSTRPLYQVFLSRKGGLALFVVSILLAGLSSLVAAAPPAQSLEEGQAVFQQKCAACHTIGGGQLAGPDLQGVTGRRDHDWLIRWIVAPDQMVSAGDPLALQLLQEHNNVPMPNMGVSEAEAAAILAYIEAQSGATTGTAPATGPVLDRIGDPAAGRALFTGSIPLANGGTACIACHSVSQVGALGGGTLGPDLTHVATRYGETGLAAALQGLPFPTMQGVFDDRPLTEDEVAHLYAYFVEVDQRYPAEEPVDYSFVWVGLGGSLLLGLLSHVIWRKRHTGVRLALERQARIR